MWYNKKSNAPVKKEKSMPNTSLPKVAIVGRPNVGKSSLFNRIVGSRKAIVESSRGTTRDRLYADIAWKEKAFMLIDTGGFEASGDNEMTKLVLRQLEAAIKEADIIFFVTDGAVGISPQDIELASRLRKTSKRIYLIVNKIDDESQAGRAFDFFELGLGDPYAVSAVNYIGIERLLDDVAEYIAKPAASSGTRAIGVAIVGRPNVGKSSYLNSILNEERVIVHPVAGTTRDAIDIDFNYKGRDYLLIDTAGIRHKAKVNEAADFFGTVRSKEAIRRSDVAVVIIDGYDGLREDDARIIDYVIKEGKALVVAVNKSDLINAEAMQVYNDLLIKKLNVIRNFPVLFTSCKTKKNVITSLDLIWSVYEKSRALIPPEELAAIIESLKNDGDIRNKRITVLYLKQESTMPPQFILGVKSAGPLTDNTKNHIENFLRRVRDFKGVPIRVSFENLSRAGRKRPRRPDTK